jgi:hypothetical protein
MLRLVSVFAGLRNGPTIGSKPVKREEEWNDSEAETPSRISTT